MISRCILSLVFVSFNWKLEDLKYLVKNSYSSTAIFCRYLERSRMFYGAGVNFCRDCWKRRCRITRKQRVRQLSWKARYTLHVTLLSRSTLPILCLCTILPLAHAKAPAKSLSCQQVAVEVDFCVAWSHWA